MRAYHAGNDASQDFLFMDALQLLTSLGMTIVTTYLPRCALHVFFHLKGSSYKGLYCTQISFDGSNPLDVRRGSNHARRPVLKDTFEDTEPVLNYCPAGKYLPAKQKVSA
jgi:hypothetical protein